MVAFQLSRRRLSNVLLHSWGKHCEPLLLNIIGEPTYLERRVNAGVKHKHGNRVLTKMHSSLGKIPKYRRQVVAVENRKFKN